MSRLDGLTVDGQLLNEAGAPRARELVSYPLCYL